jgi:hypothetical protein
MREMSNRDWVLVVQRELAEDAVWDVAAAANPTRPVTTAPATEVKQADGEQLRVGSGWFLEPQPVSKQSD